MNTLIFSGLLIGLLIGYLLIGVFIFSIIDAASAGDIDYPWIMVLWPFVIVATILAVIITGIIEAGSFIGDKIYDKLN